MSAPGDIRRLLDIMAHLRHPERGCPWDREQDFSTIAPHTIEEAYEVADAILNGDLAELRDELGDLLFQVVFHARLAEEQGEFAFADVVQAISDKMERRHPHVFGEAEVASAQAQTLAWEDQKERERAERGHQSVMDGVPRGMAEIQRSVKLQKRAARVGFDWESPGPVLAKLSEEAVEIREAIESGDGDAIEDEMGDLMFVMTNLARQLEVDPAKALRRANAKFERRFRAVEQSAGGTEAMKQLNLDEMESLWQEMKNSE